MSSTTCAPRLLRATRRVHGVLTAVLVLSLPWAVDAVAQPGTPEIEISVIDGGIRRIKIEMENFVLPGLPGDAPQWQRELDDIVHTDLDYSDLFDITRWYLYPGTPAHPTSKALIRGSVERAGDGWTLRARVEALPGQDLIFQKEYPFDEASSRRAMHTFADEVVVHVTGLRPGIAMTQVVFVKRMRDGKELWIVDYDGANLRQLTRDGSLNLSPSWSPDGAHLVFTTYVQGPPRIALREMATGTTRVLATGDGLSAAAVWSPDGRRVVFARARGRDTDLYVMDRDGSNLRPLTNGSGIDTSPTFSPSGREIAFVSDRAGSPQIYMMDASGGRARRVTYLGSYNDSPTWSPSGKELAFVSRDGNVQNIYVMTPSGEKWRPIVYAQGDSENPSWAPDGRHIVYSSLRGEARALYIRDVVTGRERLLTTGGGDCYGPAWSPGHDGG